ncbi:hypothetical protein M8494_24935 [Serratia ureilytica]
MSARREGFAVTDEGLLIYQETVNLLAATEAFRRGVDEVHQRLGGQLHVAIFDHTVSNPQAQIGRAIALFSERAPRFLCKCTWSRLIPLNAA